MQVVALLDVELASRTVPVAAGVVLAVAGVEPAGCVGESLAKKLSTLCTMVSAARIFELLMPTDRKSVV